jgi:hypothetical protein
MKATKKNQIPAGSTVLTTALVFALILPASVASARIGAPLPGGLVMSPAPQAPTVEGTWSTRARASDDGRQRVQVSMEIGDGDNHMGFTAEPGELSGLSFAQASGTADNIRFELVREAGTVVFEGSIRDGLGAGTFAFTPAASWQSDMAQLGYDGFSEREVFSAAVLDLTTAFVGEIQGLGYTDLSWKNLFAFTIHGVSGDFIRGMNGLGYDDIEAEKLIAMRIHGVTVEWVEEVRRAMGG